MEIAGGFSTIINRTATATATTVTMIGAVTIKAVATAEADRAAKWMLDGLGSPLAGRQGSAEIQVISWAEEANMRRRRTATLTCAGILSVAVGLGIANAQSPPSRRDTPRQPAPSTTSDTGRQQNAVQRAGEHHFVAQAALANMAEIQLGHLAIKKAQQADVKKFAQMMVDDHVKAQKELADAASGAGIQWPTQLDDTHRQLHQRLSTLSNEQFDREYMKAMVDGHRDVEKMLTERVGEGGPASDETSLAGKVNQWAAKTLPAVRAHLERAEQVSGQLAKAK
jgi:putative membrane protein